MSENELPEPPNAGEEAEPKKKKTKKEPAPLVLYNFPGETKEEKLQALAAYWGDCQRCFLGELRTRSRGKLVFGEGNANAHVVIVGEAPGEQEEQSGWPFVGPSGHMLDQLLANASDSPEIQAAADAFAEVERPGQRASREKVNAYQEASNAFHDQVQAWRQEEFFITNVVACRPPENRNPTNPEAKACWERLWNIIYIVDPLLIIAVGGIALSAVTQKNSAKITEKRGQIFDVEFDGKFLNSGIKRTMRYPVMPLLHPSYLGRIADWKLKDGFYAKTMADVRRAMESLDFQRLQNFNTPIPNRGTK